MDVVTHTKFHFNQLALTFIFGIRASERLGLKRPGLIGLNMHYGGGLYYQFCLTTNSVLNRFG